MKRILALFSSVLLASCASLYDEPTQEINVVINNLGDDATARCVLEGKHDKKNLYAPGTITVQRRRDPLIIYCQTANGDEAAQVIPAQISKTSQYNVLNIGLGFVYDAFSDTAWAYPDVVDLDFTPVSEAILEKRAPYPYSEAVWASYEEDKRAIIEKTRKIFEQAESFEIQEKRTDKVIVPENVEIDAKRSHLSQPITDQGNWNSGYNK